MLACFGYLCLCSFIFFFILVTRRECPHSSLCRVCFVKHHLLLSFPKVLSKICVVCPVAFFFPLFPHFVVQFEPSVGSQALGCPWGDEHRRELPSLPEPSGGRQRRNYDTKRKERHQQELLPYSFLCHSIGPVLLLLLFPWGSETAPQKGGAVEFGSGSMGMAGNTDSWISPLFVQALMSCFISLSWTLTGC